MQKHDTHKKSNLDLILFSSMNARLVMNRQPKHFSSKRIKEQAKTRSWYQSTYVALVGTICFLLIYYVISLNTSATLGYDIKNLENTQNELKIELERLGVKIAEIESLETLTSDSMYDMMVPTDDPDYLVIREGVQYVYNN